MQPTIRKIIYACTLLLILFAADVGQAVHIFTEDPLHYVGFCRDMAPDNGADDSVVAKCVVDNYPFYSCVCVDPLVVEMHFTLLDTPSDASTCAKLASPIGLTGLRAPPARA